jgi:hypothetical protein
VTAFACYELGIKYELDDMRQEGLLRLNQCYPASFDDWKLLPSNPCKHIDRPIIYEGGQEFDVAAFAGRHQLHSMASTALYECYSFGLADLAGNVLFDDIRGNDLINGVELGVWVSNCILKAYPRLCSDYNRRIRPLAEARHDPECLSTPSCQTALRRIAILYLEAKDRYGGIPFCQPDLKDKGSKRPCDLCWEFHIKKWQEARRKTWESLPDYLGLPKPTEVGGDVAADAGI